MQNMKIEKFFKSLESFKEVINTHIEEQDVLRDASIQRFEFTFELAWKMLKDIYWQEGIQLNSPKEVFKHAFSAGLIKDEKIWLNMLQDRNLTSNTYNEDLSKDVFASLPLYLEEFLKLKEQIKLKM
jgi:nucleotidyltransferase substrate binding protein (TIGR01987 family)